MGWLRDRWYAYVPALLFWLIAIMPMPMLPLLVFAARSGWISDDPLFLSRVGSVIIKVASVTLTCCVVWISWVIPWFEAGNTRAQFKRSPRQFWVGLQVTAWFLCILTAVFGLIIGILIPFLIWDATGRWRWEMTESVGIAMLAIAVLLAPATYWYQRKLKRRFLQTLRQRQLCFICGYDLRGNPQSEHCPECGHVIEWNRSEVMQSFQAPG